MNQTKQSYPFGASVDKWVFTDGEKNERMSNYFYDMFNWAVTCNDMKWRFMEPNEVCYDKVVQLRMIEKIFKPAAE